MVRKGSEIKYNKKTQRESSRKKYKKSREIRNVICFVVL